LDTILRGRLSQPLAAIEKQHPGFVPGALLVLRLLRERKLTKRPATAELLHWVQALLDQRGDPETRIDPIAQVAGLREPVELAKVPALWCLIKLREDLEKIGLRDGVAQG
jgi:hypothetical protein